MGSENGAKTKEILTKWVTTRRRLRRRPLGVLVVTHLVRISYVFAPFSEPVLAPGIIFSPAGRGKFYNPGWLQCICEITDFSRSFSGSERLAVSHPVS